MTTLVAPTLKLSRGFPGGFNPFTLPSIYSCWVAGRGIVAPAAPVGWYDPIGARHFGAIGSGTMSGAFNATGGPNSTPVITFNGSSNVAFYGTGSLAQPNHVFVVAKFDTDGSAGTLIDSTGGNISRIRRAASTTMEINTGSGIITCAGCTPLSWHLHEALFSGASSFYKEDGVSKGTGTTLTTASGRFVLGAFGSAVADFAPVSVGEVWVFSAALTGANLANFKRYITAKYGPTISLS